MINLSLKTEYSFKQCFGHIKDIVASCKEKSLGIADINNTYGHIQFSKECKKAGIKPIFGVRLHVVPDECKDRTCNQYWIFIAKNNDGLEELYRLVTQAHEQKYYFQRLFYSDVKKISNDLFVIRPGVYDENVLPPCDFKMITPYDNSYDPYMATLAIQDNFCIEKEDIGIYELLAGSTKRGDEYIANFEQRSVPMHILDKDYMFSLDTLSQTEKVADECNAEIPVAEMVSFDHGDEYQFDLEDMCVIRAAKKGIDLPFKYIKRLEREIKLIREKGYEDYFLIVSDMLDYANEHMLVGPSRGSSAGSLVCYLLGITKIDPLKYGLIFERFIDVNRFDLPDIDIDFPDSKRHMVIKYLTSKYGKDNVKNLSTISRLKAKSAMDLFGIGLCVPKKDCEELKNSLIERMPHEERANMCLLDTFEKTEPGKEFISNYPEMALVTKIEGHAQHAGKHAAGIIVSNIPLTKYGAMTAENTIMMDKKDAEEINLLKIDCLGLTTLSVLEDAADLIGEHKDFYYDLPLDDELTFKIFQDGRLNGIFQFEGSALKMLNRSFVVNNFDDIVAITALARPGALRSGGAAKFAKRKNGESEYSFYGKKHEEITGSTYGVMVYQEQMMHLAKELAGFSWSEVSELRKIISKSLGGSHLRQYKDRFIEGCKSHSDLDEEDASDIWKDIEHAGAYAFNKSHAVSYSLISYFTAYMKAHHPLEFLAASLNHARSDDHAIRMLRDGVENDGVKYTAVDPDESLEKWCVVDGALLGGLTNIPGVGEKKAKQILKIRSGKSRMTPAVLRMLENPKTGFDILFPTQHLWGDFFTDPASQGLMTTPTPIRDIDQPGEYTIIGKMIDRNLKDLNEYSRVQKRGYEEEEDTLFLNIILEDDHDSVMCSIGRYQFDALRGRTIAEKSKVGEDWFLVQGKMTGSWRGISVTNILNLTEWSLVTR